MKKMLMPTDKEDDDEEMRELTARHISDFVKDCMILVLELEEEKTDQEKQVVEQLMQIPASRIAGYLPKHYPRERCNEAFAALYMILDSDEMCSLLAVPMYILQKLISQELINRCITDERTGYPFFDRDMPLVRRILSTNKDMEGELDRLQRPETYRESICAGWDMSYLDDCSEDFFEAS